MKKLCMLVVLIILFTTTVFAQSSTVDVLYLKNGSIIRGEISELNPENVKIKTSDGSLFVYPMKEVEKMVKEPIAAQGSTIAPSPSGEPTPQLSSPPPPVPKTENVGTSFKLRGGLFGSVQNWDQLADQSADKFGYGFNGDITAGIKMDDMYIGIGPHLGISSNTQSEKIAGYTGTGTTTVQDVGGDILFGFDDMYLILGLGSADVTVTATIAGRSETLDFPDPASYKLVSVGWGRGFAIGITYVSYSGWEQNAAQHLGRFEFNLGWMF